MQDFTHMYVRRAYLIFNFIELLADLDNDEKYENYFKILKGGLRI